MKLHELQKKVQARAPKAVHAVQEDVAFQIGKSVEAARARQGMTQAALAERVGTKQPSIARIERGLSAPSVAFLKKIADALDMSLDVQLVSSRSLTVCQQNTATSTDISSAAGSQLVLSPLQDFDYKIA